MIDPLNLAPIGSDLGGALVIAAGMAIVALAVVTVDYARACIRRYRAMKDREVDQ